MKYSKDIEKSLDIRRFSQIVPERRKMIEEASDAPLPTTYGVNQLAERLHPGKFVVKVADIKQQTHNSKTLTLVAVDKHYLTYFRAGQYITVSARVGNSQLTRPYSLASSPKKAKTGVYEITVADRGIMSHYLCNDLKIGDELILDEACGDFYHDSLRDCDTVVAVAGGSGVTPFVSMARAIEDGTEEFNLILLYGARKQSDLMYRHELQALQCERVKVVYVLSEEHAEGCEYGFVTKELFDKYASCPSTVFMCGPDAMYSFVDKQLKGDRNCHSVRREHNCCADRVEANVKQYNLTVTIRDKTQTIKANSNETLLVALERAGIAAPSRCRSGVCGFCHSLLLSGKYSVKEGFEHRRLADFKFGWIHPCCTFPDSDIAIDVPANGGEE